MVEFTNIDGYILRGVAILVIFLLLRFYIIRFRIWIIEWEQKPIKKNSWLWKLRLYYKNKDKLKDGKRNSKGYNS